MTAIIDDDPSVRPGFERLIRSVVWKAETFAPARRNSWRALGLQRGLSGPS